MDKHLTASKQLVQNLATQVLCLRQEQLALQQNQIALSQDIQKLTKNMKHLKDTLAISGYLDYNLMMRINTNIAMFQDVTHTFYEDTKTKMNRAANVVNGAVSKIDE